MNILQTVISALIGAIVGGIFSYIIGCNQFYMQVKENRKLSELNKIQEMIILINRLLHDVEITLKSQEGFFDDPNSYYQREHPQGEYFENYNDYYDYRGKIRNQIFDVEFYNAIQTLKAYIIMFLPTLKEKIIQLENNILEVNPMLHQARDVNTDYFKDLKNHIMLIAKELNELHKAILMEWYYKKAPI